MKGSIEHQEWTGVILAGGRARRFDGLDKGSLIVDGRPIIARLLDALVPVTSCQLVVANDPARYSAHDVAVVPDRVPGLGPLGGLHTALETATTPALVAVACDMPFVTTDFVAHLQGRLGAADAAIPRAADGRHVLCAAFATRVVAAARAALSEGRRSIVEFLDSLSVVDVTPSEIAQFDPAGVLLANVNTDADYRRVLGRAVSSTSA